MRVFAYDDSKEEMMAMLKNKVAFITGAASGIGAGTAPLCAAGRRNRST